MPAEPNSSGLIHELSKSRQARTQAFAAYLKGLIIDWQYKNRTWITSASELGRMLGVSDVTANDWLKGKTLPRREQCIRIADTLGVPMWDVLEGAGYSVTQDDSYNTFATIIGAVEKDTQWPEEKRKQVRDALIEAISPPFTTGSDAADWRDLANLVLQQKSSPLSKAEKIAGVIEIWHRRTSDKA